MTRRERFKKSSHAIWTLIRLQFRAGVKLPRGKTPIKTAVKLILLLSLSAVLLGGFVAVYYFLANQFISEPGSALDLRSEFLIFTLTGFMVLQTLFLIPLLIKVLDLNNDRELLLKLPVSSRQIFISKIIVAYFYELIFTAVILFPILLAYGLAVNMSFGFYLLIPVILLFVPVLPFFIATLVMFPVIKLVQFLRSRSQLTTLLYLAGLVLLIVVYMNIINGAVFAIADSGFKSILETNASGIKNVAKYLYPPAFLANMIDTSWNTALVNFVGVALTSVALIVISFFLAGAQYKKIYMDERGMYTKNARKTVTRLGNSTGAVVKKDVKNIFRSSNYTFQFLLIVVITPLLVFFCNRIAGYSVYQAFSRVGLVDRAQDMIFGVSMFVIMLLIPLASSFAASNISREGYNIYHTKLIPVSYRKQLCIKAAIVFIPILISVLISCGLTMLQYKLTETHIIRGLTFTEALTIFSVATLMSIGYICFGTYLDLKRPLCNQVGTGELVKSTASVNTIMLTGVIVGALLGVLGMFSGFAEVIGIKFSEQHFKILCVVLSGTFAIVSSYLLFVTGPKRYYRLEQ